MSTKYRLAAGLLVKDGNGNFLGFQRPGQTGYDLPGGKVEEGEPVAHAAIREIYEETGIVVHVELLPYFADVNGTNDKFLMHTFAATAVAGSLRQSAEGLALWLPDPIMLTTGLFGDYNSRMLEHFRGLGFLDLRTLAA